MARTKTLTQCYAIQDLLFKALTESGDKKPDLAKLALAWERIVERQRILRGRPLPGSLRPGGKKVRGRGRSLMIEPSFGPDAGPEAAESPQSEPINGDADGSDAALG